MAGEDKYVNIVNKSKQGPSPRFITGSYHNTPESKTKISSQTLRGQPKKITMHLKTPKKLNVLDISDTESEELFVAMIE